VAADPARLANLARKKIGTEHCGVKEKKPDCARVLLAREKPGLEAGTRGTASEEK